MCVGVVRVGASWLNAVAVYSTSQPASRCVHVHVASCKLYCKLRIGGVSKVVVLVLTRGFGSLQERTHTSRDPRHAAALRTSHTAGGGGGTSLAHGSWHPEHAGGRGSSVSSSRGRSSTVRSSVMGRRAQRHFKSRKAVSFATVATAHHLCNPAGGPRSQGGRGEGGSGVPLPLPGTSPRSQSGTLRAARMSK
eukprot:COSAG01_NODE_17_length_39991_cov_30.596160_14_plen_193_part_00